MVQLNSLQGLTEMPSSAIDDAFNAIKKCMQQIFRPPYMEIILSNWLSVWLGQLQMVTELLTSS